MPDVSMFEHLYYAQSYASINSQGLDKVLLTSVRATIAM